MSLANPIVTRVASTIACKPAGRHVVAEWIDRGNCVAVGERDQVISFGDEQRVGAQKKRASALRDKVPKGRFNLWWAACI